MPCASLGGLPKRTSLTTGKRTSPLANQLLTWYDRNRRVLPWRSTSDPYHIVVAEFMLHQTRVSTVLPYYNRFLAQFPGWSQLASAPLDRVLKVWEGLGYYARARHLHQLAMVVCQKHGGRLPASRAELLDLPGIGDYTAGAILSIAFGQDEIAVDGNVKRVLARLQGIAEDPFTKAGAARLEAAARCLLPPGRAGQFNQALMDLGSSVCTPRQPNCQACPWKESCYASAKGLQTKLPARRAARPLPHFNVSAGVIWKDGRVLIAQRPPTGLLGGLWEFPGGKQEADETLQQCLLREVREELAIDVDVGDLLIRVEHAYTHFRITLHAFSCRHLSGEPQALGCTARKWVWPAELGDYAFPTANRRIIQQLLQSPGPAEEPKSEPADRPGRNSHVRKRKGIPEGAQ